MIKNVKCPDCLNENSLPIEPTIHPIKGFYIEVWACKSCGAEMEGNEYMQKLKVET